MNDIKYNASVGIIGCGWLGKALAKKLLATKAKVIATSSQQDNVNALNTLGITAQILSLPVDNEQLLQHDVFLQQQLVVAIPPKFKQGQRDYPEKMQQIVQAAEQRGIVQRIILLSSSAIYNGLNDIVDEQTPLNFLAGEGADKVQILYEAEQAVLNFTKQSAILRLAGLVGPDRHPGKFLLNKSKNKNKENKELKNPEASVNLIHQQDAIGLIVSLLDINSPQGVFNGVSDTHISKKSYYQAAAKALNVTPPIFMEKLVNIKTEKVARIVNGDKAKLHLSHSFVYPDLLAWL